MMTAAVGAALGASLSSASAQVFPVDEDWVPLRCADQPMQDPVGDQAGATMERDIVGDADRPAGLRAVDDEFLYLRLRLDANPATAAGELRPFGWGFAFDLNRDRTDFELLILARGATQTIELYQNETTTLPNDPADPPDQPAVATYAWDDGGRSVAAGSQFGNTPDRFLDLAVPWDDLSPLGLNRLTAMSVWAATSSNGDVLDADVACHDATTGDPELDDTGSDVTTPGEGELEGGGTGEGELEGGGGCAAGAGASGRAAWWLAGLAIILARRHRATGRRG
jgi:hypothetical protein